MIVTIPILILIFMNQKKLLLQLLKALSKYLLLPFSWLYGTISSVRNNLYDRGVFKTYESHLKTIVIGNLQVGGSGKTPHTAFLYNLFKEQFKIGVLSRGYGRKTKGLIAADDTVSADIIGDEPYWYYKTLKDAKVVVSENRKTGLQYLEKQNVNLVLLDDAYQHRAVTCNVNILLTDYQLPYYQDFVLPYGRLREWKTGDKRAHFIIVTKCPENMNLEQKIEMIQKINPYDHQHVFFTGMKVLKPFPFKGQQSFENLNNGKIIAMSGIANPNNFLLSCSQFNRMITPLSFNDHHSYVKKDIRQMLSLLDENDTVLITEKDATKLVKPGLLKMIPEDKLFVLPVLPYFLFKEEEKFKNSVRIYLK